MKKNYLLIYLFCLGILSYGEDIKNPNINQKYKGKANYERVLIKVADDNNIIYNYRFSKDLDTYNMFRGNKTNYIERVRNDYEDVDYVGVNIPEFYVSGKFDKKAVMYFGKDNSLRNLNVKSENDFKINLKKVQENKKEEFYVHKGYSSLHLNYSEDENRRNPLSISIEEYKNKLEGKIEKEKSLFIKEKLEIKLKELGIQKNLVLENDKLYSVEQDGKKYPIYYELKPVTVRADLGSNYQDVYDDVYNVIWINNLVPDSKKIEKLLYTKDNDLIIEDLDQYERIEVFGRGRIEGEIDLNGKILDLNGSASVFQGKYGRSLVLGSKAKLKNVKAIYIGIDQLGLKSSSNLGGMTSLSLDIDPSIKNVDGNIIGHAFADLEDNIDIQGSNRYLEDGKEAKIQLMTSRISDKATILIDKPFEFIDATSGKKRRLYYKSDSILHHLNEVSAPTDAKAILSVEPKNEIKKLSKSENEVYKSIASSKKLHKLSPTVSTVNKKLLFSAVEIDKESEKKDKLEKYLTEGIETDKIIKDLSEFTISNKEKEELKKLVDDIKTEVIKKKLSDETDKRDKKLYEEKINNVKKLEEELKIASISILELKLEDKLNKSPYNSSNIMTNQEKNDFRQRANEFIDKIENGEYYKKYKDEDMLKNLKETLFKAKEFLKKSETDDKNIRSAIVWLMGLLDKDSVSSSKKDYAEEYFKDILTNGIPNYPLTYKSLLSDINKRLGETINLKEYGSLISPSYRRVKELLYYSLKEEEALNEFKTMVSQLQDTNIWAKMNKVAKNELTTYTNIPFDVIRSLGEKKHLARGGYISARNVQQNFKGNTYTAYGLYENQIQDNLRLGLMVGGSTTNHTLTHNKRTAKTTPATSTSKGISAYIGAYAGKKLYQELNWISGIGFQYGKYDITRNLRNNYQTLTSKGSANIMGLNTYSGLILDYPLQEDVVVQVKGILSYSFINQGKVREKEGLNLDIQSKNYQYLDSEIGVNFSKTLYDFGVKSNLSAGVSRVMGVYGYKNSNLNAKVSGSSSSFGIKGDKVQKDALKLFIDYNVQKDSGLNYGLDGTYITNSKETDVRFGFKAGYTF